ncbi:MAG: helix-turn-helix domain-containing protein [candidate division KSB1 bacterium]|nr:helix-turn-helix domain-containing protein [candidate division KSB1 bacterium]
MGAKTEMIAGAFADGQSIAELQNRYRVKKDTIVKHLNTYVQTGNILPADRLYDELDTSVDIDAVMQAFEDKGAAFLTPVYEKLNKAVSYDELRLQRLYFLCRG